MAHDIFVSHSTKDKIAADAVVAHLEREGLRCWCAPRDILPGASWASSIMQAINGCKAMVVVFSSNANASEHIRREVERAVNAGVPIVPVRIEAVLPQGDLEYFLSSSHWMDAISMPVERHFGALAQQLRVLLKLENEGPDSPRAAAPPVATDSTRSGGPSTRTMLLGLIALLLVGGVVAALLLWSRHENRQTATADVQPATRSTQSISPVAVTPASSLAPAVSAVSASPTAEAPVAADSPLAEEYRDWKKLTLITWDNYYLIDHARERYAVWRRAADQGDAIGQFFVGYCYQHGLTVPEEPSTAFEWFMKSATQKNSDGMFAVAVCCAFGLGTKQNAWDYARWIKDAVDAGNTSAMVGMGIGLYTFPVGPTDKEQGKQWIAKGAAAGNFDGVFWDGLTNSNSAVEMGAQMQKAAAAGQPDALIAIVENDPAHPQGRSMVAKAFKMMGNPLLVARIIDPTLPGGFYHKNLFPDLAAARLREMARNGSAEATRFLKALTQSGKIPDGG